MIVNIEGSNVNNIFQDVLWAMKVRGVPTDTRNGPAVYVRQPLAITYHKPWERVLFAPERDCNPYFHLFEAIWMLAGRNDVAWISQFNGRMKEFSDDGITLSGSYGNRWRNHFGSDQIAWAVQELQSNPNTRRAVLAMWDPVADMDTVSHDGKDVPCNTTVMFQIRADYLDMMVTNRSNDVVWGMCGANAVHMSILQEYVAGAVGCGIGFYYQVSMNAHLYTNEQGDKLLAQPPNMDLYSGGLVSVIPFYGEGVDEDILHFIDDPAYKPRTKFFEEVANPMSWSWEAYKRGDFEAADRYLEMMPARNDWRMACRMWLARRASKKIGLQCTP